jgi:hypothetical protein
MAEETVKLTADAVWQDGTPFSGYLEVTLQETGATANSLVAPKRQQEIAFENGLAEITLVPSSALDGAKYRIRVMTTSIEGNYKSKTALLDKTVEIPDSDCTLHELVAQTAADTETPAPAEEPGE